MAHPALQRLAKNAKDIDLTWRYMLNLKPTLSYKLNQPSLSGEAECVLKDLNQSGIAITSVGKLLGNDSCFMELAGAVDELEAKLAAECGDSRAGATNSAFLNGKSFIHEFLGDSLGLDPTSVYARFALQQPVLQVANAYFGMYTQLRFYNVWHTFVTQTQPRQSQLWHQDREDRHILKVFVYFSDVDEGAGPFTYAAGTHLKGHLRHKPKYILENGVKRSSDSQMAEVAPREQWIKGVGRRGTMIFADTHGYHKGGLARERERIMYVCKFTSQRGGGREFIAYPRKVSSQLDQAQTFAMTRP